MLLAAVRERWKAIMAACWALRFGCEGEAPSGETPLSPSAGVHPSRGSYRCKDRRLSRNNSRRRRCLLGISAHQESPQENNQWQDVRTRSVRRLLQEIVHGRTGER